MDDVILSGLLRLQVLQEVFDAEVDSLKVESDVRVCSYDAASKVWQLFGGIESVARAKGRALHFEPKGYVLGDDVGDVFFYDDDGTRFFQIVSEAERVALLGGEGK